jgi:hypothetical protein
MEEKKWLKLIICFEGIAIVIVPILFFMFYRLIFINRELVADIRENIHTYIRYFPFFIAMGIILFLIKITIRPLKSFFLKLAIMILLLHFTFSVGLCRLLLDALEGAFQ